MMRLLLVRFLETYYRHRWLYWSPAFILLVVFGVSLYITKDAYIAHGTIWVQKQVLLASMTSNTQDSWGYSTPADVTVAEATELMQSDAFVRAIVQQTSLEPELSKGVDATDRLFAMVRKAVWWTAVGNNLIEANASHERADVAQQLATGAIQTYLNWQINNDKQESQAAQTFFSERVKEYTQEADTARGALQSYLEAHPDPVRGDRPSLEQLRIDKLENDIKDADDRLSKAKASEESARLQLAQISSNVSQQYVSIDQPALPAKPEISRKKLALSGLIYLGAGVLLSILGVIGGMLLDTSLHFPGEVSQRLGLPALAVIPDMTRRGKAQ